MSWDTAPARDVSFTVTVNGVVRAHEPGGITWAQDITSDLPSTVTAGGQVGQRTGMIRWARQNLVETRTPSPWYAGPHWIPTVGDRVTIDAHDGTNTHRVFTGVIDTVEGDANGNRSSKIVAPINGANRVTRRMAQTQVGGLWGGSIGRMATTPVWVISEIARDLGYASVPPAPAAAKLVLDAPLQGSTYVYHQGAYTNAALVTSHRAGYPTLHPVWSSGPDGFGISDAVLEWEPQSGGGTGAGALGISVLVYSAHASDALLRVRHGADTDTYLRITADKRVRASTYTAGTTTTHTHSTPVPAGDGPHRVSAIFTGHKIRVTVAGVEEVFDATTPGIAVSLIRLEAGVASCVAGLQIWHPSSPTDYHAPDWAPTAFYRYGTGTNSTALTPSIRDERAGDVLQDYADALLCPLWLDGHGVMQVVTGKALHDRSPELTVDALRDVSDLSYTMALLDHRPTVEVTYAHAFQSNTTSTVARTKVWQGNGGNLEPDSPDQTFAEVPTDEEWIGLADPAAATRLVLTNVTEFNQATGSWWGLAAPEDEGGIEGSGIEGNGTQLVETLTPWAWKVTTTAPAGGADLRVTEKGLTGIHPRYRGMDLPIYRARSLVRYEDRTVAVTGSGSTPDGVLTHDAGKWITTTATATQLAQWIHSMVGTPTPVLENLVVRFDPRIEVGMKLTVAAKAVFGVDFQALVLSVDHDPGNDTSTLIARVTWVGAPALTLDEVDFLHIGQSLTMWENARTGRTLTQVDADPLTTT